MTTPVDVASIDPLPKELRDKTRALAALAMTHNLLKEAPLPFIQNDVRVHCMNFITSLYEDCVEEALAHPEADKSDQLRELRKEREEKKRQYDRQLAQRELSKVEIKDGDDLEAKTNLIKQ